MNCVDFLLQDNQSHQSDFILGRNEVVSYPSLIDQVLKLTQWLKKEVGVGEKIILISPNNNFSVVSYLAIMKSGNVVVPLNPAIEEQGLQHVISICEAKYAFLTTQVVKRLNPDVPHIIDETQFVSLIKSEGSLEWYCDEVEPDTLAQIIFTSGSTALPKGVMISHKNIIANTTSIIKYLKLNESDIIEIVLPFFYCYGLSLLHTHLKVGGSIVLNNTFIFLGSVIDDLTKYKCTGFAGVPSHFQILLRKSDLFKKTDFSNLRYVTQAGGKLHTAFIKEFTDNIKNTLFYVMYGQTEATARLSYLPPERLSDKLGSLGKGIPDVELKVVNADGKPVKPGEVGEIIAKGDNVMLGYYKEQEETSKIIKGEWLYTGDLATVDEDGFIYHAARKKEIIKVGGKRVSPKEIEEVIVSLDGVIDCTVEGVEDELLGEAIRVTVVVNKDYSNINEYSVKEYCASKLSAHKVPGVVVFEDSIKVNSAGKKVKKV